MNIRLKFEILTFSAALETHFASISMLGAANSTFVGQTTLVLNPSCFNIPLLQAIWHPKKYGISVQFFLGKYSSRKFGTPFQVRKYCILGTKFPRIFCTPCKISQDIQYPMQNFLGYLVPHAKFPRIFSTHAKFLGTHKTWYMDSMLVILVPIESPFHALLKNCSC